jgi:hypothetical protein
MHFSTFWDVLTCNYFLYGFIMSIPKSRTISEDFCKDLSGSDDVLHTFHRVLAAHMQCYKPC